MKKLLIYNDVTPVTRKSHGKLSVKKTDDYAFARETNAVPLVVSEFPRASEEYAIVFTEAPEGIVPAAILGARDNENIYVGKNGAWGADYVPAFIRRYPFVFATDEKAETFTLMIDEKYDGFNKDGKGERLFDSDGEQTVYLKNTLQFLQQYQAHFGRTRDFGNKLKEMGLLEPVEANVPLPKDPQRRLTGFQIVNREKLKALGADKIASLLQNDELEMIFLHLFSLRNLGQLHEKLLATAAAEEKEDALVN